MGLNEWFRVIGKWAYTILTNKFVALTLRGASGTNGRPAQAAAGSGRNSLAGKFVGMLTVDDPTEVRPKALSAYRRLWRCQRP